MWRPERRAKKYLSARLGAGRAVARAREMAQMAAAGGADAPFGVSCTPAARPRRAPQKYLGDLFVIYQLRGNIARGENSHRLQVS